MRNLKPIHAICNRFRSITLSHCTTERGHLVPKCTRSSLNTKPQTNLPNLPGLSNHIHCTDRTKLRWCLTSRSHSLQPYSLHQPSCCLSRYYSDSLPGLTNHFALSCRLILPALFHLIDPNAIIALKRWMNTKPQTNLPGPSIHIHCTNQVVAFLDTTHSVPGLTNHFVLSCQLSFTSSIRLPYLLHHCFYHFIVATKLSPVSGRTPSTSAQSNISPQVLICATQMFSRHPVGHMSSTELPPKATKAVVQHRQLAHHVHI
jgi:hypothetical protein